MTSTDPNAAPSPAPADQPSASTSQPSPTGPAPASPASPASPAPPAPPAPPTRSGTRSIAGWVVGLALGAVVGALLFLGGYLAAGGSSMASCSAPAPAFVSFCDAYTKLKTEYVDPLSDAKLANGAIQGMFQFGVQDPHSGYMSPQQYQQSLSDLSGKFSGIGAEMSVKNIQTPTDTAACGTLSDSCVLVVVSPISGSPAEKAGLQPGDIITAVDGSSVNGSTINDEVARIRGAAGSTVTLTIKRGSTTFDLKITRQEITTREVDTRLIDGHIGYIALHSFSDAAPTEFHSALAGLLAQGADQIVFDLRNDPGGYIEAAQKIASEFVSSGTIFTQDSAGGQVKTWDAVSGGLATNPKISLVVLVNGGTASASEIVTAALQEHGRATVIGMHTYGKNTIQVWAPLPNGGGVRITISRWFTPHHNSVNPNGIQPDIAVTIPAGTPPETDLVLQRAITFLGTQPRGPITAPTPTPSPSLQPAALAPAAYLGLDDGGSSHWPA